LNCQQVLGYSPIVYIAEAEQQQRPPPRQESAAEKREMLLSALSLAGALVLLRRLFDLQEN